MHRIGVVGLGKIATDQHLPAIAAHPDFSLIGVADPQADFSGITAAGFRSHREMLAALPELDAVAVCTPPGVRRRIAHDALGAGKHVLIEKPPAGGVAELLLLRDAAAHAGRVLFTAWHSQHTDAVDAARARLREEVVTRVEVAWKEDVLKWHPGQAWIWEPGGFGVFDPGINVLSILTRILPEPLFVRAATLLMPQDAATPIAATLEFGLGGREEAGRAEFDWRREAGEIREVTLHTESGTVLRLEKSGARLRIDGEVVAEGTRAEYPRMYDHFATLLRDGRSDVDAAPLILACDALQLGRRSVLAEHLARPAGSI